jgi:hypothetical protein
MSYLERRATRDIDAFVSKATEDPVVGGAAGAGMGGIASLVGSPSKKTRAGLIGGLGAAGATEAGIRGHLRRKAKAKATSDPQDD